MQLNGMSILRFHSFSNIWSYTKICQYKIRKLTNNMLDNFFLRYERFLVTLKYQKF